MRVFRYLFRLIASFVASTAAAQLLSVVILGLLVGGAVSLPDSRLLLATCAAGVAVSLVGQTWKHYYDDRNEPHRILRQAIALNVSDGGRSIQYTLKFKVRAHHSTATHFTRVIGWTGDTDIVDQIRAMDAGYTVTSHHLKDLHGQDTDQVLVDIQLDTPLRRFRSRSISIEGNMTESSLDKWQHLITYNAVKDAHSLFSSLRLEVNWDESLAPLWDKVRWEEYKSTFQIGRGLTPLDSLDGQRLGNRRRPRSLGVRIQPVSITAYHVLKFEFHNETTSV